MRKLVFTILAICGCLVFPACSSHPVSGSCPVKDFNGECALRWSDCNLSSGNPSQELSDVEAGCHALGSGREPLLVPQTFNTKELPDCLPLSGPTGDGGTLQTEEACYGTADGWNGASVFYYNVFCCQ